MIFDFLKFNESLDCNSTFIVVGSQVFFCLVRT